MTPTPGTPARRQSGSTIRIIQLLLGAVAIAGVFWLLQFSTNSICCGDYDGYYHIKWSRTLWEGMKAGKFPPEFPWLPLPTLNSKEYIGHRLLFHIMQITFAEFSEPRRDA